MDIFVKPIKPLKNVILLLKSSIVQLGVDESCIFRTVTKGSRKKKSSYFSGHVN